MTVTAPPSRPPRNAILPRLLAGLGHQEVLSLAAAVTERRTAGLDPVPIQIAGIPGRYVSSEQSSIVQYLNGGPGSMRSSLAPPPER